MQNRRPFSHHAELISMLLDDPKKQKAERFYQYGLKHFTKNEIHDALVDFTKAITKDPTLAKAYFARGHVYLAMNELDLAQIDFKQALEMNYNSSGVYDAFAEIHYREDDISSAIADNKLAAHLRDGEGERFFDIERDAVERDEIDEESERGEIVEESSFKMK